MSYKSTWAGVTEALNTIRETIKIKESIPVKYKAYSDLYEEMTKDINLQADVVASMIKAIAAQSDETTEDVPF